MTSSPTWVGSADREMPTLSAIVTHWAADPDTIRTLPHLRAHWIGWGEPFCFRCGWLAPVDTWTDRRAGGWLERAHLQDHCLDGCDDPTNIVPLCIPCHDAMPQLLAREDALHWVSVPHSEVVYPILWQTFTDSHAGKSASSGRARVYRLKAQFLEFLMSVPRLGEVFSRDVVLVSPACEAGQRDAS